MGPGQHAPSMPHPRERAVNCAATHRTPPRGLRGGVRSVVRAGYFTRAVLLLVLTVLA